MRQLLKENSISVDLPIFFPHLNKGASMKKTLTISCLSVLISLALAGCGDDDKGKKSDPGLKANGSSCALASECTSGYCGADKNVRTNLLKIARKTTAKSVLRLKIV